MLGIFLDTETNGLNPQKHCILELAYKIIDIQSGELLHSYQAVIGQPKHNWDTADPHSLLINGFRWEEVSEGLPKEEVAGAIITAFAQCGIKRGDAVFICQNPSFDRAFFSQLIDPDMQEALDWPYHWLDLASMYWAIQLRKEPTPWETGVSKDRISEAYQLPPEEKPHRAMNGVDHLILCYGAVVGFPHQTPV
ncbi:MAG: hypothetical protein KR126chlam1_00336 [Chlamydiae bacterium]|nr:hypothetical protein [Chlamydiota bacterium]